MHEHVDELCRAEDLAAACLKLVHMRLRSGEQVIEIFLQIGHLLNELLELPLHHPVIFHGNLKLLLQAPQLVDKR